MSNTDWLDPHLSPVSVGLVVLAATFTAWSGLVQSPRRYRALVRARASGRSDVPRRFYQRSMAVQAARCVLVLVVLVTDRGVENRDLGLVLPVGRASAVWGWFAYFVVLLVLSTVVMRRVARAGRAIPGQRLFDAIIPRPGERLLATGVAVGAGVSEELLFRGLFLAACTDALGGDAFAGLVVVSLAFGAMHLYQGLWGIVGTGLIGLALGSLYLSTHSLLVPVLIHILVDLRAVLFVPLGSGRTTNAADTGR